MDEISNNNLKKRPFNPAFIKKLNEARASKAKGDLIEVDPQNIWEKVESGSGQELPEADADITCT